MDHDIAELVRQVVAAIPRSTRWKRMTGTPVPDPDAGQTGHCPRCGRALPRFSANAKMKVGLNLAMPRDRQALIDACLVDGPRTVHAVPITAEDVTRAARSIAEALQAAGWSDWAATLPDEAEGALDSTPIEPIGQALEVLRLFGPAQGVEALNALVASSGRYWTPGPTVPE